MSRCFAYIRVSTSKQREQGASLEAQREAIQQYALRHRLDIVRWYEESETAAKRGRTEFNRMLAQLREGAVEGVVIHKIDRSARNLRDWSDLAELVDQGITIHLAAESIDLTSRGGRLSADIQAVVAADYIRNLRDETLKGIRARYRQGLLPGKAPVGYQDNGGGQVKTIDPVKGPLVREMFERYATGRYTLQSLAKTMNRVGLRNTVGGRLEKNGVSRILNNRFYVGLIDVKRTSEVYPGIHKPLVSKRLFESVQQVLTRKHHPKAHQHTFPYRKLFTCGLCGSTLSPERQKGYVYYRCHQKDCDTKTVREEALSKAISDRLAHVALTEAELATLEDILDEVFGDHHRSRADVQEALQLEIAKLEERESRLTDLYLDQALDRDSFRKKKEELTRRKGELLASLREREANPNVLRDRANELLELARVASLSYREAPEDLQRNILLELTSNRTVSRKEVSVELREPFSEWAKWSRGSDGCRDRDVLRTLVERLVAHCEQLINLKRGYHPPSKGNQCEGLA